MHRTFTGIKTSNQIYFSWQQWAERLAISNLHYLVLEALFKFFFFSFATTEFVAMNGENGPLVTLIKYPVQMQDFRKIYWFIERNVWNLPQFNIEKPKDVNV